MIWSCGTGRWKSSLLIGGGLFKSRDGGAHWSKVLGPDRNTGAIDVVLAPGNPDVVYAALWQTRRTPWNIYPPSNGPGSGLYRSRDGGASWLYLGLAETRRIGRVAVDPSNPDRIFVAGMGTQFSTNPDRGLYRSDDGGVNWSKVLFVNDSTGCADVVINPAHPETVYCATWERVRHPTYRRAFSPRVGIAYTLNPKTVIRSGFGLFWSPTNATSIGISAVCQSCAWTTSGLKPSLLAVSRHSVEKK